MIQSKKNKLQTKFLTKKNLFIDFKENNFNNDLEYWENFLNLRKATITDATNVKNMKKILPYL